MREPRTVTRGGVSMTSWEALNGATGLAIERSQSRVCFATSTPPEPEIDVLRRLHAEGLAPNVARREAAVRIQLIERCALLAAPTLLRGGGAPGQCLSLI